MRIKTRKIIKDIIQKEEKKSYSKTQLRLLSKKIFDKIYQKINKKKLNYFDINENIIEEIMKGNDEQKYNKDNTVESLDTNKSLQSQQVSYCQNIYKSEENFNPKNDFTYFDKSDDYSYLKNEISFTPSENFNSSAFDEIDLLCSKENTSENLFYQENLSQRFDKFERKKSFKKSFDFWTLKSTGSSVQSKELCFLD